MKNRRYSLIPAQNANAYMYAPHFGPIQPLSQSQLLCSAAREAPRTRPDDIVGSDSTAFAAMARQNDARTHAKGVQVRLLSVRPGAFLHTNLERSKRERNTGVVANSPNINRSEVKPDFNTKISISSCRDRALLMPGSNTSKQATLVA